MKIYKVIEKKKTYISTCGWCFYTKEDAFAFIDTQKLTNVNGNFFVISEVVTLESRE